MATRSHTSTPVSTRRTTVSPQPPNPLRSEGATPIVPAMGDKSPKAKQRDQKQKDSAKATNAGQAKAKQESYSHPVSPALKGKR